MALYGRGSEWRRWDLHIHAPGTALNDDFGNWDEFVEVVEQADKEIAVVGVTDYCSINTYKVFKEHHDAGRMQNITLALPNIEFRVSPETKAGKGINLHLLVSPDDPEHIERIEEALSRLKLQRYGADIPCSRAGLTRLGKLHDKNLTNAPDAAYREGVNQFKVDVDLFREWLKSEEWLSQNALVAVSDDGEGQRHAHAAEEADDGLAAQTRRVDGLGHDGVGAGRNIGQHRGPVRAGQGGRDRVIRAAPHADGGHADVVLDPGLEGVADGGH